MLGEKIELEISYKKSGRGKKQLLLLWIEYMHFVDTDITGLER